VGGHAHYKDKKNLHVKAQNGGGMGVKGGGGTKQMQKISLEKSFRGLVQAGGVAQTGSEKIGPLGFW